MSKHFFPHTLSNCAEVMIELGFDNPLQEFFMHVDDVSHPEARNIYSSLQDPTEMKDSAWLAKMCATYQFVLPQIAVERLACEMLFGGSNEVYRYEKTCLSVHHHMLLEAGFIQAIPAMFPHDFDSYWIHRSATQNLVRIHHARMHCILVPVEFLDTNQLSTFSLDAQKFEELLGIIHKKVGSISDSN